MEKFAEAVYETMTGQMNLLYQVPEVENLFEEGTACDSAYEQMLEAYGRLRQRLHSGEEDADCEILINALLEIQHHLAIAMFCKGYDLGQNSYQPTLER